MIDYFKNWKEQGVEWTSEYLKIGDRVIMYEWERPLMRKYAELLAERHSDVLEVGFGMGILAEELQNIKARSHTILEPHPAIAEKARQWAKGRDSNITIIEDFWQNCWEKLGEFDGIMFDPVEEKSFKDDTFTFFKISSETLLRKGGRLGFFYSQPSLAEEYKKAMTTYFDHFEVYSVKGLKPTPDFIEKGIKDTMLAVIAITPEK